jgi:hypothetical protein
LYRWANDVFDVLKELNELASEERLDEEDLLILSISIKSSEIEQFLNAYFSAENGYAQLSIIEFADKIGFEYIPHELSTYMPKKR